MIKLLQQIEELETAVILKVIKEKGKRKGEIIRFINPLNEWHKASMECKRSE